MADALESHGAEIRAIETYRKALFLEPLHWFAAYRLAALREKHGYPKKAAQAYRQALEGISKRQGLIEPPFDILRFPLDCLRPQVIRTQAREALGRLPSTV